MRRRLQDSRTVATSHSKGAPIYYMTARVSFKKRKDVHERVVWIVSVFESPYEIMKYDLHAVFRLGNELYGKNAKSEKSMIIREIIDKKIVGHSTLSIDEHKEQYKEALP